MSGGIQTTTYGTELGVELQQYFAPGALSDVNTAAVQAARSALLDIQAATAHL